MTRNGVVLWFTGFSGSGKSTLPDHLYNRLYDISKRIYLLDGDSICKNLSRDLDFSREKLKILPG